MWDGPKCGLTGVGAHATLASECRVLPQQQLLQRVGRGNGARLLTGRRESQAGNRASRAMAGRRTFVLTISFLRRSPVSCLSQCPLCCHLHSDGD